ncbi:MAG: HAMP domain-containing sensor histidine kinase [Methylobacter sp.]|nr:HAMP domain-containing sensor histidine kinase [Methylobacter sp.]
MNFCLSLILMGFAYLQPGTLLIRRFASAMLLLGVAFFISAYGPLLPRATTVMGTNMLLLAAGVVLHTGFASFCRQQAARYDYVGWGTVGITALPFWYWGLVEPNGHYRSVVFSCTVVLVNSRTAVVLLREVITNARRMPIALMGGLFMVLTVWMLVRGIMLLLTEAPATVQSGANPTLWITVFWYIVLAALMTGCVIWMEINRLRSYRINFGLQEEAVLGTLQPLRANLLLLWSMVTIFVLAIVSELFIVYQAFYQSEYERLLLVSEIPVDDISPAILGRMAPILVAALLMIVVVMTLALILSWVVRQREEQSQLLVMLSHELKTPLSVLRLALGAEVLPPKIRQLALRSVLDMNAVIERCLQTDRLYYGRIAITKTACNLGDEINALCTHHLASERLLVELPTLPVCHTDRQIVWVILSNLIDNALKYSQAQQPVRITAAVTMPSHTTGILVSITNTVAANALPDAQQLFHKYYRGETAHKVTGSGLGLYLARRLAKALGGQLSYAPDTNEVTFNFWIPL